MEAESKPNDPVPSEDSPEPTIHYGEANVVLDTATEEEEEE